jgi:hypothetical protein
MTQVAGHLLGQPGGGLALGAIDVHWRQILYLLLAEADLDAVDGPGHGADRDGHVLTAPQMPLLQEHMRHAVAVRIDDQPSYLANMSVAGMNVLAAPYLHLADRDRV